MSAPDSRAAGLEVGRVDEDGNFESLASDGIWHEIERSESYRAFAIDEPHVTVATYVLERL